jgi:hypothetical protein
MDKRIALCLSLALAIIAATLISNTMAGAMPSIEEIMNYLDYTKGDGNKLRSGEIISHGLEAGSEKELAVTVGMLVRAPLSQVFEFARSGEVFKANREIIEFHDLGDAPHDKSEFDGLGFNAEEADEVAKLLEVEPGHTFNLSTSEIDRFKALSGKCKAKGAQNKAVREAVNAEYRAILMQRYEQYREGGLGAVGAYDRGDKQSSPGKELTNQAERGKLLREKMPEFYRTVLNYPRYQADDVENQFFLIKQRVNKRPAFILAHRLYQYKPEKYALAVFREFYVGHSYNSLHIAAGLLPVKEGTVVFYLNRTSTDQVAGFGSGMKRKIGSQMLRDEVIKLFSEYRRSLEKSGSKR